MPSNLSKFLYLLFKSLSLSRLTNNTEARSRIELKTTLNRWACQRSTVNWPISTHSQSLKSSTKSPTRTPVAFLHPLTFRNLTPMAWSLTTSTSTWTILFTLVFTPMARFCSSTIWIISIPPNLLTHTKFQYVLNPNFSKIWGKILPI